jgi:hypothetical protein
VDDLVFQGIELDGVPGGAARRTEDQTTIEYLGCRRSFRGQGKRNKENKEEKRRRADKNGAHGKFPGPIKGPRKA